MDGDTNAEIRRRRLEELCGRHGGVRPVAEHAKMNWQALEQVLRKAPLPKREDGQQSYKSLGDAAARKLEDAFDLGRGWFDWPFQGVDFKKWEKLNRFDRARVEGRLIEFIDQALATPSPALDEVAGPPVSDSKVRKHYKAVPAAAPTPAKPRKEPQNQ